MKVLVALGTVAIVGFVLCSGVFLLVVANSKPAPKKTPEQIAAKKQQDDEERKRRVLEQTAIKLTEAGITKILKAPTTAKFRLEAFDYELAVVAVTGDVTSQNAFSAMLTQPVCAYYLVKDGKLDLASISLNNEVIAEDEAKMKKVIEVQQQWKSKNGTNPAP